MRSARSEQQERHELHILGRVVRAMRQERGLGLAQLATAAELDVRLIAALELGEIDPRYDVLIGQRGVPRRRQAT
jgi:ribosome-binding protein aMBF1 (putative translation factor)